MTLDGMSNSPFVSHANIWQFGRKKSLVVNQVSLRAFFHAPLQFTCGKEELGGDPM